MYSMKSVGSRMEPWGTPALTGYSHENFPSRTILSTLLLRKKEIRLNIRHENSEDLSLQRRPTWQTLSKALNISRATAQIAHNLLKALAILSDTIVRRPAVDWEDLKPYWKSTILLFTSFSKTLKVHSKVWDNFYHLKAL